VRWAKTTKKPRPNPPVANCSVDPTSNEPGDKEEEKKFEK
jgi:hypothetical protein